MQQKGGDKKRLEIFDKNKKVMARSGDGSRKEQTKARTPMTLHEEKDGTKSAEDNARCNCRNPSGCKKAKEERDAADGCKKTQEYLNKRWNEEMEQGTSDTSEEYVDDVSEEKSDTMQDTGSEDEENIKMMIRGLKESLESKREKGEDQLEEESKLDDREIDEERVEESKLARLNAREVFQGGVCRGYQLMMSSQQPDALQL